MGRQSWPVFFQDPSPVRWASLVTAPGLQMSVRFPQWALYVNGGQCTSLGCVGQSPAQEQPMLSPDSLQIHASDQKGTLCPTRPATPIGKLRERVRHVLRRPLLGIHCPDKQGITAQMLQRQCMAAFGGWSKEKLPHCPHLLAWPADRVPR